MSMHKHFLIRPLQERDPEPIAAAFARQGWNKPVSQYLRYLDRMGPNTQITLVAENEGDFAGYLNIVWQPQYPYFQERGIPEIQDFNVLMKYRRLGIGKLLMDEAEKRIADRSDAAGIRVGLYGDYGAAQVLYVRRGYVPDGKGISHNNGYLNYGEQTSVDDDLVMGLTKKLR